MIPLCVCLEKSVAKYFHRFFWDWCTYSTMIVERKERERRRHLVLGSSREDDIRLAALAAAGDREAEHRVAQALLAKVRRVVSYAVNDPVWAEDLTQSAMLKIFASLPEYRGDSSLSFWGTRIAIRIAIKAVKRQRRRRQLLFFLPEPISPFEEPQLAAFNSELRWQINRLVQKLSIKQQIAVQLRYVHEYNIREIAELTNAPENTVRDRLRVGKKKLKKLIDKNPALKGWIFQGKP
jgi:RNA polymerase sigma-70 factor, ECF subfamily